MWIDYITTSPRHVTRMIILETMNGLKQLRTIVLGDLIMQTIGRETSQINMSICQIDDTFYRNFPQKHGWVMLGDIVAQITESSSVDLSDHQESEVFGG